MQWAWFCFLGDTLIEHEHQAIECYTSYRMIEVAPNVLIKYEHEATSLLVLVLAHVHVI